MTALRKMLGYGLTDLQLAADGKLSDERINKNSKLLDWEREDEATVEAFVRTKVANDEELERVLNGWNYGHLNPKSTMPFECVELLTDFDMPATMVMRPIEFGDWYRSNNVIDVADENLRYGVQKNRVEVMTGGIYPFGNSYIDLETLKNVDWYDIADWVRAVNSGAAQTRIDAEAMKVADLIGLEVDSAGLSARIAPRPPDAILDLAAFGELFTKPEYVYQLRPMLVTWWR